MRSHRESSFLSHGDHHAVARFACRLVSFTILASLVPAITATGAPPAPVKLTDDIKAIGDIMADKGAFTVKGPKATLIIGADGADAYRLTAEVKPANKATQVALQAMPTDVNDVNKPAVLYGSFYRDEPGLLLTASTYSWNAKTVVWDSNNDTAWFTYWPAPTDKARLAQLADSALAPRSLKDRWLRLRIEADRRHIRYWLDGMLIRQFDRPVGSKGPVALHLNQGDEVRDVKLTPLPDSPYLTVDITPFAHSRSTPALPAALVVGGVPFELAEAGKAFVDLRQAHWIEQKKDPADYYENYEGGPPIVHDPRMPLLRVPSMDYTTVHVLAAADDDPATTPHFTLRAGRYGASDQVVFHSFPGTAPRKSEAGKIPAAEQAPGSQFFHVQVPFTEAFSQDVERWIEIELTKEIRLARRQPDPCRFRSRPLGLPSGVRIAALTLERSPLQMQVTSKETGHAFVEPQKPTFKVHLTNITGTDQTYDLALALTHLDGTPTRVEQKGRVAAGTSADVELATPAKRGYHEAVVTLRDGAGRVLQERKTSCALLPPDTRKHRDTSPFGTWDFCGGHFTPNDPDVTGPLYVKAGFRWGMAGFKPEKRKQYGILAGSEPNIFQSGAKGWEDTLKSAPDQPPIGLLFHETAVSGKHLTRIPELFSDLPRYKFDAEEEKTFRKIHDEAMKAAREMRAKYPRVHLKLGNGALPTKEAMYQAKFPAELFDSAGNENPTFGRPPEAQPPDCVTFNASIWMDRQMLDAYGYPDKPVTLCYESCYPATSPGNVSLRDQADYLVRHSLHALAWGMPEIKLGQICDMGNGYYFSNWGAIGLCRAKPELNVKPSFVAVATMTRVLDGAKFVRVVPMGSPALYGMEFTRPDGTQAHAFWTLRGKRSVRLLMDRPGAWSLVNDQGMETPMPGPQGVIELELTPSPVYLLGAGKVEGVGPRITGKGAPEYMERPAGKNTVLAPLADLGDWTIEEGRDPELEFYDFMCPRRKGDFAFTPAAAFEGKDKVLQVAPRRIARGKDTMPMYAVLAHKKGIPAPGQPTEVGVWVNGNGGWGRLIFELQDASGQRWISLGAEQTDAPRKWVEEMTPPDLLAKWPRPGINDWNTGDVFSISRINFDGWRWLAFPMPGSYPGEKHPWPANSQWRWDKDGVVHYPLTFKRLIVELPEKVLHVKTFAPPPRPEIYLKDLTVGQDDRLTSDVPGPDR
jgi:hypothetical protein